MKRAGWWLVWCLCALLYPLACVVAWALQPRHRPGPWQPRARGRGVWLVCLAVVLSAGCATAKGPAGSISKVRAWWQMICDSGDSALAVAETVSRGPEVDAGAGDASTSAESDAAEGGAP